MTFRHSTLHAAALLGGSLLLTVLLFLPGCSSVSSRSGPGQSGRQGEAESEADFEKRVATLAHYATGLTYELNEKPELALEQFVAAAQADPHNEPVVIEAARRCLHGQKFDQAIELLSKATGFPDASGSVWAWLGLAYAQAGKNDLAISASKTAIKKMPQGLAAYQNLAQVYLQNNRTNEALRVLDEAARQPTDNPVFLIDLAELYLRYGRAEASHVETTKKRAEEILDRAADLGPGSPFQLLRLADDYVTLNALKKAEPFYRQLLEDHPDVPNVRAKLIEIYLRSGEKTKASEQLESFAENEPTNPQPYILLGAIELDEKEPEEKNYARAAEYFERALRLDPDLEQVYYDLAGLKINLKKPEESLAWMEKARARFKVSFPLEFYTGVAYGAMEKYQEALKYFTSAEAIAKAKEPARLTHTFYFQVGSTYERAGNLEEAEKYFRQCLQMAPEDAEALNYLGYMWADRGVKLDEARTMIEKALRLEPDNAAFLDSLAWVLFKLNKPAEALPPMLKALEHSEKEDSTLYDHLGDIYTALKQFDQAREAWSKALKIKPDEQIDRKLKAAPPAGSSPP